MASKPGPLPLSLYHGTSTIFLEGIIASGLGGRNPIREWKVLEAASEIQPLVREHLASDPDWMAKAHTYDSLVAQRSAGWNFQHGDSYLTPSPGTAIRYAANDRYGSEILSCTLDLLQELLRRKAPGVADGLIRKFPLLFDLVDISCAPVLVRVSAVNADELAAEDGGDPGPVLNFILSTLQDHPESADVLLQQSNFRLRRAVPLSRLALWLVVVSKWHPFQPKHSLHRLAIPGACGQIWHALALLSRAGDATLAPPQRLLGPLLVYPTITSSSGDQR